MTYYGGIEAGGTKFVCAIGRGPGDILTETRFPTTTPAETLGAAVNFFREAIRSHRISLEAIGIGSFGPLELSRSSASYGQITSTPKPGWANTPVVSLFEQEFDIPIGWDTDVNAAALGEGRWGAARGLDDFLYLTIGTGVGGGAIINGRPLHGLVHPEMGHMLLPARPDGFTGVCPFHTNCFEGLANGPSLAAHWGQPAQTLPADHPAWEEEAAVVASALHGLICTLSPTRIILGGGVMQQLQLFPLIRQKVKESLNGYVQAETILDGMENYIVPPSLGGEAGVLGAFVLAQLARG
ncbi:MAG TPA: ROK family protein [Anaerolineaceae bacterium]|nr:ROK family protein [Anaerolineaceae bacterium]